MSGAGSLVLIRITVARFGWVLLIAILILAGIAFLVWVAITKRYRLLRYGIFLTGLSLTVQPLRGRVERNAT
jgi:maltodextrin utilization protein YvdJ